MPNIWKRFVEWYVARQQVQINERLAEFAKKHYAPKRASRLHVEKGPMMGIIKDDNGVVRGLWFPDRQSASNAKRLSACAAMLQANGEVIDNNDRMTLQMASMGNVKVAVEAADDGDGYIVKFPSAQAL